MANNMATNTEPLINWNRDVDEFQIIFQLSLGDMVLDLFKILSL
jgi:hypothetical protein